MDELRLRPAGAGLGRDCRNRLRETDDRHIIRLTKVLANVGSRLLERARADGLSGFGAWLPKPGGPGPRRGTSAAGEGYGKRADHALCILPPAKALPASGWQGRRLPPRVGGLRAWPAGGTGLGTRRSCRNSLQKLDETYIFRLMLVANFCDNALQPVRTAGLDRLDPAIGSFQTKRRDHAAASA